MYIVNALVRLVLLFNVFGKRTNHILTVKVKIQNKSHNSKFVIFEYAFNVIISLSNSYNNRHSQEQGRIH